MNRNVDLEMSTIIVYDVQAGDTCYPWRVEARPGYGRVVVATRDISCHELVLEDDPVGLSPTQDCLPSCLSCLKLLPAEPQFICDCGFPLCSPACSRG